MGDPDILVVVSKLKSYVKNTHGMSTSATAASTLSDHVRRLIDEAAANAQREGRKTVMDRDFR